MDIELKAALQTADDKLLAVRRRLTTLKQETSCTAGKKEAKKALHTLQIILYNMETLAREVRYL